MAFQSVLFDGPAPGGTDAGSAHPAYFADLHLDQIAASITVGRASYDLTSFFRTPLSTLDAITYRHEVFRDLGDPVLLDAVHAFAEGMQAMRDHLAHASRARYHYESERWFLEAAETYAAAVRQLAADLTAAAPASRGLTGLRAFLAAYVAGAPYRDLAADIEALRAGLGQVAYRLHILGPRIRVSQPEGEVDYGADVLRTFDKFKQGEGQEYRFRFSAGPDINHVEAAILDRVALLYPEVFGALDAFCQRHRDHLEPTIGRFDREVQFYLATLEHVARFTARGLAFCYPQVTDRSKAIHGRAVFDLALADVLARDGGTVITNDFQLAGAERILVVSGPNQGGKTTFARTIGQLHHLAAIGCPVPAAEARLYLADRIFTHFEREEDLQNLSGKLEDELHRMHAILAEATADSLLVMNESFGSTTLDDALFLSKQIMRALIERDLLVVAVTFLDELASLAPSTVSMVSTIDPRDPAVRTFRIERRPADGLAYAAAIAAKYNLTYRDVRSRLAA